MMNVTRGEGRALRERKPVNYNLKALELGQYSDDEGAVPKQRKIKSRSKSSSKPTSEDESSQGRETESGEDGTPDSCSDDEGLESDNEVVPKKPSKKAATRKQPSRNGSASVKNLKEASISLDSDSSAEEEPKRTSTRTMRPSTRRAAGRKTKDGSAEGSGSEGNESDEDDESESSEESSESKGEKPIARGRQRTNYSKICKVLDRREADGKEEYYVAFSDRSYRKCEWVAAKRLAKTTQSKTMIRAWQQRQRNQDPDMVHGLLPEWTRIERIISFHDSARGNQYLVKWCGLPYVDCTWEFEDELLPKDMEHVERFKLHEAAQHDANALDRNDKDAIPQFLNGRSLRDYQVESLKWMVASLKQGRNCILGDEMGLGKTAQSIAVLEYQRQVLGIRGPFLVVAPLTTLGHWTREIETWTGMNVVQYAGTKEDREMIREHEFEFSTSRRQKEVKFDVLLTSYEMLLKDKGTFLAFGSKWPVWQAIIIDEAHRLKALKSATRQIVFDLKHKWLLLLTGTPVQNNMRELFGVLNLLDPEEWGDEEEFYDKYGGDAEPPTVEQIQALQVDLRPILLRRMKEDVEKLPEKEEVIVWVELTRQQRFYYKALFSQQIGTLLSGANNKNLPNLRNLAMELRKVCCHPYLCNGLEDDIADRHREIGGPGNSELERMVNASGKMVLLHKLLPKLRAESRKVLIFSQFKIMLDVIEDSLNLCKYPHERIDGSIAGRDRQQAIDRFTRGGKDTFIFLLSTRAGGQGITLTEADTVVIYDSDWNPQNDLQAMARCHRIGQEKDVTVYRLICKDTYEQTLFSIASRKYGLDEAILGGMNGENPEQNSEKIAELLKHGAHSLIAQEDSKAKEGEAFANEDIAEILAQRTEKRQIGNRAGNTFSTAQFTADLPQGGSDRDYWAELMPDDVAAFEAKRAAGPTPLGPRKRRKVNYADSPAGKRRLLQDRRSKRKPESPERADSSFSGSAMSESDSDEDSDVEGEEVREPIRPGEWKHMQLKRLLDCLVFFGPNHFHDIRAETGLEGKSAEEVTAVCNALMRLVYRGAKLQKEKDHLKMAVDMATAKASMVKPFSPTAGHSGAPAGLAEAEAELAAAKRAYAAASSNALHLSADLGIPAAALKALEAELPHLQAASLRYKEVLKERNSLAAFLEGVADGVECDTSFARSINHSSRVGMKSLPPWWGNKHDMALLFGCFLYGHRVIKHSVESALRDPDSLLYNRLSGPGALAFMSEKVHASIDNVVGPDHGEIMDNVRSLYSSQSTNEEDSRYQIEVKDVAELRKVVETIVNRTKTLVKQLVKREPDARRQRTAAKGRQPTLMQEPIDDSSSGAEAKKPKANASLLGSSHAPAAAAPAVFFPKPAGTLVSPSSGAAAKASPLASLLPSHAARPPQPVKTAKASSAKKAAAKQDAAPSKAAVENRSHLANQAAPKEREGAIDLSTPSRETSPQPAKKEEKARPGPSPLGVKATGDATGAAKPKMKQSKLGFVSKQK